MRNYVGTPEAAAALGVHTSTLYRWRTAGYVRSADQTLGGPVRRGRLRWDIDDLRRQLAKFEERNLGSETMHRAAHRQ